MARITFWFSFLFVFYVYIGYPLMLVIWRWFARLPVRKGSGEPVVTLVLAAHNERETLEDKLINCLELDYPREKLQIIVSLDGSTDGTQEIAERFARRGVEVIHCERHEGKAAALNRAVAAARGELLVFVDTRQRVDRNAIRALATDFQDPTVGAAAGELILLDANPSTEKLAADAVGLYWKYEKWLRLLESDIHSSVGASGALYAIRRNLFQPVKRDTILDDVAIPMRAVLVGKRLVFESGAKAYDRPACCAQAEFRRKVRTLAGNYQLIYHMPELLNPRRNPVCLQFLSHKIGRLLVPYCLVALFLSNLFLLKGFYLLFLGLQATLYLLAFLGAQATHKPRSVERPQHFLLSRGN